MWRLRRLLLSVFLLTVAALQAATVGTQPFTNFRNPPAYRTLTAEESARYDLGMTVFNTPFLVAGTPGAGRRDGIGPLFNSSACDQCHNNGAHGRGPGGDGPAEGPLVVQLGNDPVYGQVFNTNSVQGVSSEGVVMIHYQETPGRYPDGAGFSLRVPHYSFSQLHYGPLAPATVVKPRLAPALFGVGLLDAAVGRHFGWQSDAVSVEDQTGRAFAREMGLTSRVVAHDDCTHAQVDCLRQPAGGSPEVSDELFDAVLSFQRWLAVPASPAPHRQPDVDSGVFADLGCVACHQPRMTVRLPDDPAAVIAPYTDMRLHDMGPRLADETVAGAKVASRFRTAPLWGLGYRVAFEKRSPSYLHDGRARSVEEAVLWHDGEAAGARERFEKLPSDQRQAFLHWLETL